ncbi:MAG TPA: NifU family protein [Candidatus Paceibacterota bacterium]
MEQGTAVLETKAPVSTPPRSPEERVHAVIARVRPYIQSHGGDVWVTGIESGVVTLKIEGTCAHCPLANLTYNTMVKTLIGEEAPEITRIVLT